MLRAHPATDTVRAESAAALHLLLAAEGKPPTGGDPLPPLHHWLAFLPRTAMDDLREDGHPRQSALSGAHAGWRRMFGGARVTFSGTLRVGEPLLRSEEVVDVVTKDGPNGSLAIATVRYVVDGADGSVVEEQDIIYLEAQAPPRPPSPSDLELAGWPWRRRLDVSPQLLFRFSALTYNAHRIHYDRDYATSVEGYRGLVVHGPLQAVALVDLFRRSRPDATIATIEYRALRPAFDDGPLELLGRPTVDGAELTALNADREQTTRVAVRWVGAVTI